MATQNFDLSTTWVQVAADTDDTLLVSSRDRTRVEVVTTGTDTDPTTQVGHIRTLGVDRSIRRSDGLVGFVWLRVVSGHPDTVLSVDGSTVSPA